MATVNISSPASGSSEAANQPFDVVVDWNAGTGTRSVPVNATLYRVKCTGDADYGTNDTSGSHTFQPTAPAAGTSMIVTAELWDNDPATGNARTLLAVSSPISVTAQGQLAGDIGGGNFAPAPQPARQPLTPWWGWKYVCGSYTAAVGHMICVTYRPKPIPLHEDGDPALPTFVVGTRLRRVKQYTKAKGNFETDNKVDGHTAGHWQATVRASITHPADGYQIQVWFFDPVGRFLGTINKPLAAVVHDNPCLPQPPAARGKA